MHRTRNRAFGIGIALLAAAVYCGLVVTMGEHFGVNLSLGIPAGARTLIAFLGILALRKFVDDPAKRAIWSAVATIIAYVDVPIVYFSVKWWNSLHQQQSNPNTVSKPFWIPLRANAFGILLLMTAFIMLRSRISALRLKHELAPPPQLEPAGELA